MQCPDPHTEALCVQNPHHGISNSACSPITRPQKTTVQYSEVEGIRAERLRKVLDSVFVDAACLRTLIFADSIVVRQISPASDVLYKIAVMRDHQELRGTE
jgi:hypothetical protein